MIDRYIANKHKTFPEEQINIPKGAIKTKYKGLEYYTADISNYFLSFDLISLENFYNSQIKAKKKEIDILIKYSKISSTSGEFILELYREFLRYKGLYFKYSDVKRYVISKQSDEVVINSNKFIQELPNSDTADNQDTSLSFPDKPKIVINREAIRKITGFSPYVIPKWSKDGKEVYIDWQDKLLNDDSYLILLDKSRQIGGSYTVAELIVELSFKPNEDTLVGAFTKKTTDVIRNYVLKYIRKFSEGVFEHFKSEGYILNNKSGTKVYFRTLDNGGENARGLTLRNIIVDEAQLTEDYAFEDVLEPTISTTDGKMYLIGTASMHKGYFYNKIVEAKTKLISSGYDLSCNLHGVKVGDTSYYRLDIHSNKIISPRIKEKILANKDKPSYQRERFCNWESGDEKLFNPSIINEFPDINNSGYFVITFDPAKSGKDRSAFCISYTINGIIYIIQSGFVPDGLKDKWSSQIRYYKGSIIKSYDKYEHLIYGADIRGIGEGFINEWNHEVKKSIVNIGYTSGETESIDGLNWKISKTLLITNATDLVDEGKVEVIKATNKDLLDEFNYLFESVDKRGRKAMKSNYFDDISNAFLTNLYIISKRGLLKRAVIEEKNDNTFAEWQNDIIGVKPVRRNSKIW